MQIREFQQLIDRMYSDRDRERGSAKTFLWFTEEVGELASELAAGESADPREKAAEFADVFAWLATLANVEGVDLQDAVAKYAAGCPGCGQLACNCESKMT